MPFLDWRQYDTFFLNFIHFLLLGGINSKISGF
jgi:hypothetical protein